MDLIGEGVFSPEFRGRKVYAQFGLIPKRYSFFLIWVNDGTHRTSPKTIPTVPSRRGMSPVAPENCHLGFQGVGRVKTKSRQRQ